jgi:hypothetical protein
MPDHSWSCVSPTLVSRYFPNVEAMGEAERQGPTGPLVCNVNADSKTDRPGALISFRVELRPGTASDGLTLEIQGEAGAWATVASLLVLDP